MTPRQQAKYLVNILRKEHHLAKWRAKAMAIFTVEQIIRNQFIETGKEYWEWVKAEIELL